MIKILKKLKNRFPMDYIVDSIMYINYICLKGIMVILTLVLIFMVIMFIVGIMGLMLELF